MPDRIRVFASGFLAIAAFGGLLPTQVYAQDSEQGVSDQEVAPGVNPKDNITKAEIIGQYANLENGLESFSMAFKYDLALNKTWGGNIEVPIVHLSGPDFSETAVGDTNLRVRYVRTRDAVSIISAVELVAPTAGDEFAGTGKWQLNPVVGAVYAFDQQTFAFVGYKHYFSIAGDDDRNEINRSEVRALFARLFANATWTLGDIKYSASHTDLDLETLDLEVEYGSMISKSIALSGRIGTSFLDSSREFGASLNLRKIF